MPLQRGIQIVVPNLYLSKSLPYSTSNFSLQQYIKAVQKQEGQDLIQHKFLFLTSKISLADHSEVPQQ
ncbi:hypothetical protein TTHERM_000962009 (macronuclear) [Tetrahymena thermophila SB210]|uniref:Uncharacterized protein n=1 Tax=Tetrahymena thermophila (strain SB210) TaxID=312017 RepID=W7X7R9_TETTS|nr:hypothetical protein TTHERM_000962009 [Tetrahymena thermophila SB210]EWS73387.1 hypothetical protein TTHERM_000962009 [Tetrahymena thermophila SB210]|eukprot:XP_012654077.1 hypothetical protein TTHERM_000962009 [Tetrahymena thermophila SB210]